MVQRLLLQQRESEPVDIPVGVDDLVRLVVRLLDERTHLDIDVLGDRLGVFASVTHVAAHEHLARRGAELDRADIARHAVLGDHLAGDPGGLLDVVRGAGGGIVEDGSLATRPPMA